MVISEASMHEQCDILSALILYGDETLYLKMLKWSIIQYISALATLLLNTAIKKQDIRVIRKVNRSLILTIETYFSKSDTHLFDWDPTMAHRRHGGSFGMKLGRRWGQLSLHSRDVQCLLIGCRILRSKFFSLSFWRFQKFGTAFPL